MAKLYLVDGSGYIFRAFYAVAPLSNSKGMSTNALYGFTRMLGKLLRDVHAEYIAVAFDTAAPTFRHEMYAEYKANRDECPSELVPQLPYFRDVVRAFGIECLEKEGVEADDIIATLVKANPEEEIVIVSGDKDLAQLVTDRVEVWDAMRDVHFTPAVVLEKFGVTPAQIVDYLALVGDTSDNVPGVKGIGPKTAAQLLQTFGTIENLMASISEVGNLKGLRGAAGIQAKLESGVDTLRLSRSLVLLNSEVPPFRSMESVETFRWSGLNRELAEPLFRELEFETLLDSLPSPGPRSDRLAAPAKCFEVVTVATWARFLDLLQGAWSFAFDTETTSLDTMSGELVGMSFSWNANEAFYLPLLNSVEPDNVLPRDVVLSSLQPIFADPSVKKIAFNAKFDINVLRNAGLEVRGLVFDPMIASYVLSPDRRQHNLSALTKLHLNEEMQDYKALVGKCEHIGHVAIDAVTAYACHDAEATWNLVPKLDPLLGAESERDVPSPRRVFEVLEMPLISVLAEMEWKGIRVDLDYLSSLETEFRDALVVLEQGIYADAGMEFNLNSPKQLSSVLFEHLGISRAGVRKTQTAHSTDAAVLQKLAAHHPIVPKILEYREVFKLKSTYVEALQRLVHPRTGRIHTSFNQTIAATGRLSSSEPNLQNIPVRNERGRRIRNAFIADEGCSLLSVDYSQIELRLLAHLSGDVNLQRAFHNDADIHLATAREVFGGIGVDDSELSRLRRVAKTINFGIIYGMGAFRLAESLNVSRRQAQEYIEQYFARYPRVKRYFQELEERAGSLGYVETLFGRRRYLRDISTEGRDAGHAFRSLNNAPLQGSAADIIKLAMIRLTERLREIGNPAHLLLQVHDELVLEVCDDRAEEVTDLVRREMEHVLELAVPLRVDSQLAKTWG